MEAPGAKIDRHYDFLLEIEKAIKTRKLKTTWRHCRSHGVYESSFGLLRDMGVLTMVKGSRNRRVYGWIGSNPSKEMAKALYMRSIEKMLQYHTNRLLNAGRYKIER